METVLDFLLRQLRHGGLTVVYPGGNTRVYGNELLAHELIIRFHTMRAVNATVRSTVMGFGESYMSGEVTFERGFFDELVSLFDMNKHVFDKLSNLSRVRQVVKLHSGKRVKQRHNIAHHYDIGNDFYKLWLDKSMTYSCAYYNDPSDTLEQAQDQKRRHILRKLNLQQGMALLDIGSGWGALLIMAAKEYGVTGLGVTLSEQQLAYATDAAKRAKVDHLVSFELANYQDLPTHGVHFDRVVSVGMFEHVGRAGMKLYIDAVRRLLSNGGISVLHTISCNNTTGGTDPWIDKYIFPGGYLPAIHEITDLLPRHGLRMVDYESLRIHYAMTLDEWRRRYEKHETTIRREKGDEFYRMWQMYLASCAANFRCGGIDLSQFVIVKGYNNQLPLTREYMY